MSGFAFSVGLDGRPADFTETRAMARAAPYRAARAVHEDTLDAAVAIALDGGEEDRLAPSRPLKAPDGSLLIVADARIDNRDEIALRLNVQTLAAARDDVALLLEAYRCWGESFAAHLSGEFSAVVWDARARRLVAVRDSSALRPLVYRIDGARILLASDVGQILAVPGVPRNPCDQHIASAIAGLPGLPDATFYDGIRRLPPGHTLVVDS